MDYKEKYEQALKTAKLFADNTNDKICKEKIEAIFPELIENEDEKIRKQLLNWLKDCNWDAIDNGTLKRDDIITWLEKQSEPIKLSEEERNRFAKGVLSECAISFINYLDSNKREGKMCVSNGECEDIENAFHNCMWDRLHGYYCKYIDKGEQKSTTTPKFKVGDWVINEHGFVMQIVDVQDGNYVYMYEGGKLSATIEQMENSCHLWTIQDAKDGDVLVVRDNFNSIVLFHGIGINGRINYHCKCDHGYYSFRIQGDEACLGTMDKDAERYHPATKEQRDILFQKMKEAGYEWDAENKELRKIESEPAWSEEDEERYLSCLQRLGTGNLEHPETINTVWLKSLKDRMTWKPTKEQLNSLLGVAADTIGFNARILSELYDDFKKL